MAQSYPSISSALLKSQSGRHLSLQSLKLVHCPSLATRSLIIRLRLSFLVVGQLLIDEHVQDDAGAGAPGLCEFHEDVETVDVI